MNLVDSCGWLEYVAGGPNAAFFTKALENAAALVVPTVCIYEVFRKLARQVGRSAALEAVGTMRLGTVVPLTDALSLDAATIGMHFKLPMADSIVLATARAFDADLWTQDEHFLGLPGVRYVAKR